MVICTAYLDASGSGKGIGPVLTMGGVVSQMRRWKDFELQWRKALAHEGVKVFHATDFAASKGEFESWKGDKSRRGRFLHKLVRILHNNIVIAPISVSVEMEAWNSVNTAYPLSETFYSPYALVGYAAVTLVLKWARSKGPDPRVKFVFEDGNEDHAGLKTLCQKQDVTPIFLPKPEAIPCQAADLVAWKNRIACQGSLRLESSLAEQPDPHILWEMLNEYNSAMSVMSAEIQPKVFGRNALLKNCAKYNLARRL